jgi:mRNA interferase MazF
MLFASTVAVKDPIGARRGDTQRHQSSSDIAVTDWKQAGLLAPSQVRVHKLAAVEKRLVRRKLGRISDADWSTARAAILQMLG